MPEMQEILKAAVAAGASDIMIVPNEPPVVRIDGKIQKLPNFPAMPHAETKRVIYSILTPLQIQKFEKTGETDLPYQLPGANRFRVNVYMQFSGVSAAFRPLLIDIPTPDKVNVGENILKLAQLPRGLVLVCGPTGSGKTTTLASMVQYVNLNMKKHIITVEDPIEFVYKNEQSVIDQREVGTHTTSFAQALRAALRENPDIILVGEMRDLETIELAIKAAETGHLCFSTLHTKDAPSTIDRIVSEFPSEQQPKVRLQLTTTLSGIVCQTLVPKKGGGRACAREVMKMNPAIATLLREGKLHQMSGAIQAAKNEGMCSMDQALAELIFKQEIDIDTAWQYTSDVNTLQNLISNLGAITTN